MDQRGKRLFLIQSLLDEQHSFCKQKIPADCEQQKMLLRGLMNVRPPKAVSAQFLKVQDEYLQEEMRQETIVEADSLPAIPGDSRIALWQGDMTLLKVDAIVNPANSGMCGCFQPLHNCLDNMIHSKSGISLRLYCADMMKKQGHEEPTGQAKITPGFNLPCRYIIHTVGPIIYDRVRKEEEELLASCYRSCLKLADENNVRSIALCCISTGVFRFPNERAAEIAVKTVREYLNEGTGIKKVIFNVFKDIDKEIYAELLGADGTTACGSA